MKKVFVVYQFDYDYFKNIKAFLNEKDAIKFKDELINVVKSFKDKTLSKKVKRTYNKYKIIFEINSFGVEEVGL